MRKSIKILQKYLKSIDAVTWNNVPFKNLPTESRFRWAGGQDLEQYLAVNQGELKKILSRL